MERRSISNNLPDYADPDRSSEELLDEIVKRGAQRNGPDYVMPSFAALLVKLSRDAETTAKRMEGLNIKLIWLTVAILVLTAFLCLKEGMNIYQNAHTKPENKTNSQQNTAVKNSVPTNHKKTASHAK